MERNYNKKTNFHQLDVKLKREQSRVSKKTKCVVCAFGKKMEGSFTNKKKGKRRTRRRKKVHLLPTYHPPSPGRDVVAELPFDGAFRGFSCHYAVSKLHLMLVHSPEIRHLIEKTFALACWATCSPLHTIWNHG